MSACQLCTDDFEKPWNVAVLESANFRVLPSLGALIEGWVLVVPRQHFLSLGALPSSLVPELLELKEMVCEHLTSLYGPVCVFEHGPAKVRRSVGCGVDHAHLHMVPVNFDVSAAVAPYLPPDSHLRKANLVDCQAASRDGEDYVYVEQPMGEGQIACCGNFGSQLFRRAIAAHLGIPEEFDWRTHPQIENVKKTINAFEYARPSGIHGFSGAERLA